MANIVYPQLDGVKVNEDRTLPVTLIQAIRKAYDYIAAGTNGAAAATGGGGGGTGGGGGGPDATGPVTGFASAGEIGTRYTGTQDRLVHLTLGIVPILPVPQGVTLIVSQDGGANWTWIGAQRMQTVGQVLKIDQLAPGQDSTWRVAAVAGNPGGNPASFPDAQLLTLYPGAVKSALFPIAGLATPPGSMGITATIGSQYNVISADGLTQYGVIPGMTYTDPVIGTDFFVRVTVQIYNAANIPLANEQPHGGTQITGPGNPHTLPDLLITYVPALAFIRYRIYTANRNSQGSGDFTDPSTNTLQMVRYNNNPVLANHYDVPITIPPFTPIDPGAAFNVVSVTASEVGPKYQDIKQGLHTTVGIIPVIDHDYSSPRTVTIWLYFGKGNPVWQGWYSLTAAGQVVRIGDSTLGTDGVRESGDIWVPANVNQGNWTVWCGAGRIDNGVNPAAYATANFTVIPVAPCSPTGTQGAQFVNNPATNNVIDYSLYDPGIWHWEYYELQWVPPSVATDPNLWFTMITVQKGATIGGVWTPAPDAEGINQDPNGNFLGRVHDQIVQIPGLALTQTALMKKFGANPATWNIPPLTNTDLTPNIYREFRFLIYNVSRLGVDASGSGGAGTYTLQTQCWPGNTDHYILTPVSPAAALNLAVANPASISLPLIGGNGLPLTIGPGEISNAYLGNQVVHANNMAANAITVANDALAAASVVDPKIVSLGINKVTYGTSVFAGDVVLSRGLGQPIIYLKNVTSGSDPAQNPTGIYLFGQSDATTGTTGLTSHPYAVFQSGGLSFFSGGNGPQILLTATGLTIWTVQGDVSHPYFTVTGTALTFVNGPNSVTINSNALAFVDGSNNNRLDMSSAGISVANSTNRLVITPSQLQLQLAGVAQITISATNGIVLSNGGGSSVTITPSTVNITNGTSQVLLTPTQVTITNGSLSSPAITGGSITGTSLNITTSAGNIVNINTGTSGVEVSSGGGTNIAHLGSTVISIYSGSIGSEMSPNTLLVGRFSTLAIGLNSTDGSMHIGSKTVIDANQIWRESVQCNDHIFGADFGIEGYAVGVGTPAAPRTFTTTDGRTVTVVGGIITSIVP